MQAIQQSYQRVSALLLWATLLLVVSGATVQAQNNDYVADWNSITIQGWAEDMRIRLLDRRHSISGYITDRGAFQMYTYRMDSEFGLNLFTFNFTHQEDYLWYRSPNGIRTYVGDISGLEVATKTEVKTDIEITEGHTVQLDIKQQADARAKRVWAEPSYSFNFYGNHSIGVAHTLSNFKPDLDATIFYRYGNQQDGMAKVAYTFMDYANNYVFEDLENEISFADTLRHYEETPALWQLKGISPQLGPFRVEVEGGIQSESESEIFSPRDSLDRYKHLEKNNYLAAMVEFDSKFITTGIVYERHHSEMERDTLTGSNNNWRYSGSQTMRRLGAFILANSQEFRWETWAWLGKYEDKRNGERYPFDGLDSLDHGERRIELRSRILKRPQIKGLIAGFEYTMQYRHFKNDQYRDLETYYTRYYDVEPFNDLEHRGSVLLGYQFHPRASIVIGASFDFDADFLIYPEGQRFDTGFGRIEIRW